MILFVSLLPAAYHILKDPKRRQAIIAKLKPLFKKQK
jgi:hypothetical protein